MFALLVLNLRPSQRTSASRNPIDRLPRSNFRLLSVEARRWVRALLALRARLLLQLRPKTRARNPNARLPRRSVPRLVEETKDATSSTSRASSTTREFVNGSNGTLFWGRRGCLSFHILFVRYAYSKSKTLLDVGKTEESSCFHAHISFSQSYRASGSLQRIAHCSQQNSKVNYSMITSYSKQIEEV